jgi:hypothetical protein
MTSPWTAALFSPTPAAPWLPWPTSGPSPSPAGSRA